MPNNDAWFVWAAQIVNFLILVALLRKFLYRPVLEAIDTRQRDISERVREAEQRLQEAEQLAQSCREREQELDDARDRLLADARQEIEEYKRNALEEARAEVDRAQAHWWEAMHRDRERFLKELRERAGRQVHQVARHVLAELADTNLEQQMVAVFLNHLHSLDQAARQRMAAGISREAECTLTTALPLSDELQAELRRRLQAEFGDPGTVQFQVNPDLLCGVELQIGDHRISWNVAETIESLERNFAVALDHGHAGSLAGNLTS